MGIGYLEVTVKISEGIKVKEHTTLTEISGSSARFITQQADRYFPGRMLEMTIYLPVTNEVRACMMGKATVTRVEPVNNSVAVSFDAPLLFDRADAKTQRRDFQE